MVNEYSLVETFADEKWDILIENSINGTIFSSSIYLKSAKVNYRLYYCYKKEELRAAVVLVEDEKKNSTILDDLVIYNGIIYNKPTNKQNYAQQHSEQFKIQEFIAHELIEIYENIEMSLHPSIIDIRPFLWVNYGTNLSTYMVDIRYTSYIDISDFISSQKLEEISIYNNASASRRQQIRYAIKKGYKTTSIKNIENLNNLSSI